MSDLEVNFCSSVYGYHLKLREQMEALHVNANRGKQRTQGWDTPILRGHREHGENSQDTQNEQSELGAEPEGVMSGKTRKEDAERRRRRPAESQGGPRTVPWPWEDGSQRDWNESTFFGLVGKSLTQVGSKESENWWRNGEFRQPLAKADD